MWSREGHAGTEFDLWHDGYRRGHREGHEAGVLVGEQTLRDRLLHRLNHLESDVRLSLRSDVETPLLVLRAIKGMIEDRKRPD
jgi:hypothetical protein